MDEVEKYFSVALEITKEAGVLIKEAINKSKSINVKISDIDLVTETDTAVEKLLTCKLSEAFPSHKFIGEESVSEGAKCNLTDEPTWIIDPIDGTMNFVHGNPNCCISVGLSIDKEIQAGIVYCPSLDWMFTAIKGKGAFLNNKRINVSGEKDLSKALIYTELGTHRDPVKTRIVLENLATVVPKVHGMRAWGSAALNMCSVAAGYGDSYFEVGIHCWDMAAGQIIITEAGGTVVDTEGGTLDLMNRRVLCASSVELANTLSKLLVQHTMEN